MRSIFVIVFLALGALLTLSANATVWVNRTVFDTDEFVGTVREVLDDEEVQQQLSVRVADRIMVQGDVEARIEDNLRDGLQFLAPLLAVTAHDVIQRAALRILQSDQIAAVFDEALRLVHRQVLYIVEGDGAVVIDDDKIILDLQPVLENVIQQLGGDGDGLLSNVTLPEDAGQIVLVDDAPRADAIQTLLSYHSQITGAVVAAALLCFAVAVLFARDRRKAIRNVGIVIAFCGVVAMVLLVPIRPIVSGFAENGAAGRVVFDAFVDRFQLQSFILIVLGLLVVLGASLAGETGLARAIRRSVRREPGAPAPDLGAEVRSSATVLRIVGFVTGALVLVAWPDPTNRVYVTALILMVAYFAALWLFTSDASWAVSGRERLAALGRQEGDAGPNATWVGRHLLALRIVGVVLAVIAMVLVPNLQLRSFVAIVALTLVYMALLEWLANRSEDVPDA